ncbi:MAG: flagellar biosynthesis protein FliQ [Firmicutes bacterium]|nr:flagellar biosynthesis protein FliQ [Bacillota bacterium]
MSQEFVMGIAREAVLTALYVAGPLLLISLLVGLGISILQATTQIQEQTLTFVPKIIAIFLGVLLFGNWMLNIMIDLTTRLFTQLSTLGL